MIQQISNRLRKTLETRNPAVDFLRGLSILAVILLHFGMTYTSNTPTVPRIFSLFYWGYFSRNGYLGVSAFFVISGFLITSRSLLRYGNLAKVSFSEFYSFRFARIVPPLLLLVASYFFLSWIGETGFSLTNTEKISNWDLFIGTLSMRLNLYWAPLMVVTSSLGVLWSLSIEEAFYVGFPIICRVLRRPLFIGAAFVGLFIYAVHYRFQTGYPNAFFDYFSCFDLLGLGCLLAIFKHAYPRTALVLENKWTHRISIAFILVFYLSHHDRDWETWGSTIFGLCVALFLLSSPSDKNDKAYAGKFSKLIRTMGVYSYEMYLFHFMVAQLLTNHVFPLLNQIEFLSGAVDFFFLLFWASTLGLSILISEIYSEPVRKWIKNLSAQVRQRGEGGNQILLLPAQSTPPSSHRNVGT